MRNRMNKTMRMCAVIALETVHILIFSVKTSVDVRRPNKGEWHTSRVISIWKPSPKNLNSW